MYGGGQERGLKPGTLPVPLIVGFGIATQLALKNHKQRNQTCKQIKQKLITALTPLNPTIHGNLQHSLPNCINFSIKGIDSEAAILALKGIIAISNGSACTSSNYSSSHVLQAMQLSQQQIQGALRISWCHLTPQVNWQPTIEALNQLIT
jgi:cysteine desulfurase